MNKKDLLQFLTFIAEEDAQISTIVSFFTNQLGYDINIIKKIVNYGVQMNILQVIENEDEHKNINFLQSKELGEIDWSVSNVKNEIYYTDFEYFREKLFTSNPKIPHEFMCFITE
ncbi:hypothetical protein Q5741_21305 [Paenibacillus sp. JX-17]|uniref:Uncharacterized protein n=1 Tax=Paenibacillus lacisoli TaxID=3064525 RepID=A0ABT9CI15_9BACL|nr:hypothetical protein [Paenibacillus sp. JX-17]MDO7908916.1 hypothetical protein [Paenibacillus sp. JX-17]